MTASPPTHDPDNEPDDLPARPDVDAVPDQDPHAAARTPLDGPAAENPEMRKGTEDLRSSQAKIEQAREFADDVARRTEPAEPPARPSDES